ncbi:hypothetical protein Poli38472_009528 [Pythium oligandrum]|uniref:Uncharacterized protein n=1 Tax=Pythium oligandrum TaxID=41045 RepID=A0A8K1CF28_PYTOL|nr:hypothetical protein Poli38472_009528 [Pythium oligandrum]|eukprot:TMW62035.1 hypothetical protein Poli38472_009528 [Pythium oligandrum]
MSWTATNAYSPTVTKKPSMATTTASNSTATGTASEGSVFSERAIDQARDDVVVPLVLWNEPPRMDITSLHVLYLPMSQPSQNTSALMNRWPSLASFVQQYSSNNLNANATGSSFASLNSSHSMLNLKRVLSQHRSKRNSLSVEDRAALATAISNLANGAGADLMDDDEFQYVDDGDFDTDDELYQLCVFAGTADGAIVFWLFEQDIVVQVNVLVHPSVSEGYRDELLTGNSTRQISPVQSVVSGIDEWGQSNLISVTRDGAVARWELPNGVCARADVTLAAQLAPVKGMEMFCNNRYAIVYGEQSRMMVLDTWKMTMIYCVDTAQEQNPFHRARFPPTVQKRTSGSRYLNIHASTVSPHPPPAPLKPSLAASVTDPAANFVVFTGGVDGSLKVLELSLQFDGESFVVDATVLQSFKQHRGAIKEIVISPMMRENSPYPERYVATIGEDNTVNVYAPIYLQNPFAHGPARTPSRSRCNIEWECVMAFCEHPDTICGIEWVTDRGVLMVECEDRQVYVWNLDTGVLERSIPTSLVYEGGNLSIDGRQEGESESDIASVECTNLGIGDSSLHLLKFNVNKSAELIKANWKTYYFGLVRGKSRFSADQEGGSSSTSKRATSPYAVGSIELVLLSFLLSWGAAPEIDRACRDLLGLETPHSLYSCVLMDQISGAITIPVPWKSIFSPMSPNPAEANPFPRKWQHSSALSANVALGIVSLCMNLMEHKYSKSEPSESFNGAHLITPSSPRNKEEFHVLWSQLITQHSVVLPDYVPFFREPSLEFLAKYGFHTSDYTQLAARALLSGIIKRLAPLSRSALCAEYSTKLHCEIMRLETETGAKLNSSSTSLPIDPVLVVSRLGSLVILLSMVGTCFPGEISPAGAREVCDILVYLLRAPAQYIASVAAELLTKGLMLFRPHLVDLSSLICQLLIIDMREKQRNPGDDSPTFGSNARVLASGGSNAALSLLVELGACETAFVLNLLQQEMNNADRPHAFRECILLYLTELINTHYLLMFRHLSAVVDTIMCCLDPTKPERRKRCLELSTICLHNIVRRFPMVDFHKDTQRLALGTMEAVILIYDLRTATKWRVLDGHTSAVSALSFRTDGQILVSYAAREGSVRFWNSGNAGIFGGMLKMQQSCIKEHKLEVLRGFAHAPASSGGASADLKQVIQTCRFQFLVLKDAPNGNQQAPTNGSSETNERRVLRLTREDASQVQFLM